MSDGDSSSQRKGISRRDFVKGKFWNRLRRQTISGDDAGSPPNPRRRVPLVMRYPRTLREVEASDETQVNVTAAGPSDPTSVSMSTAARRRTIAILRPPGAIDEESFLSGCTRCDECRKACPHDAIIHAPERMREAAGTPTIDADRQACMMCEDFPCIEACQPGVLTSLVAPMMGTAQVTEHLCLAHHGTTCTVCSERCPVPGAIDVHQGRPTVIESTCTGCGVCRYVCPAPENAILLMPSFLRPSAQREPRRE